MIFLVIGMLLDGTRTPYFPFYLWSLSWCPPVCAWFVPRAVSRPKPPGPYFRTTAFSSSHVRTSLGWRLPEDPIASSMAVPLFIFLYLHTPTWLTLVLMARLFHSVPGSSGWSVSCFSWKMSGVLGFSLLLRKAAHMQHSFRPNFLTQEMQVTRVLANRRFDGFRNDHVHAFPSDWSIGWLKSLIPTGRYWIRAASIIREHQQR